MISEDFVSVGAAVSQKGDDARQDTWSQTFGAPKDGTAWRQETDEGWTPDAANGWAGHCYAVPAGGKEAVLKKVYEDAGGTSRYETVSNADEPAFAKGLYDVESDDKGYADASAEKTLPRAACRSTTAAAAS